MDKIDLFSCDAGEDLSAVVQIIYYLDSIILMFRIVTLSISNKVKMSLIFYVLTGQNYIV